MKVSIDMGSTQNGGPATLNLEELLATRLLVQGNSGSGKSHLLRRLVEQSASWVQQAILDPEGDFVTLAEKFGHVVVDASAHSEGALQRIAARVREHRVSVVVNLEGLDVELQMRHAAAFLGGLFDADRDFWYPMLVVVDEAQMFAPAAAGEVSDEARKVSLGAMTNLMCRGRKRGLAGVIATQRLAKLAKNVAAEASNFLMGRTFLDIDMARAADLLGMERRQAEMFRDLERGHFIALGPALSRRPLPLRIGTVETTGRTGSPKLTPLPTTPPEDARDLILAPGEPEPPTRPSVRKPMPAAAAEHGHPVPTGAVAPVLSAPPEEAEEQGPEIDREPLLDDILRKILDGSGSGFPLGRGAVSGLPGPLPHPQGTGSAAGSGGLQAPAFRRAGRGAQRDRRRAGMGTGDRPGGRPAGGHPGRLPADRPRRDRAGALPVRRRTGPRRRQPLARPRAPPAELHGPARLRRHPQRPARQPHHSASGSGLGNGPRRPQRRRRFIVGWAAGQGDDLFNVA